MTNPRLILVGDSFSVDPMEQEDKTMTWARETAERLGLSLMNLSQHGVAQDWCFQQLRTGFHALDSITAQDRIIVVLTHPNRFWFLEKHPNLSNSHIIGMEQYVSKEQNRAIQGFFQHIQRPELDTLHMVMRLGWLAGHIVRLKFPQVLVIRAFGMNVQEAELYKELSWAQGTLFDIQADEFQILETTTYDYFRGVDCRYNHLSLRNHKIMANKVVDYFENNVPLDLSTGFHKGFIEPKSKLDPEFCAKEFNLYRLEDMRVRPAL
jgi:hypothetical protein